jgi:hypothetical protein
MEKKKLPFWKKALLFTLLVGDFIVAGVAAIWAWLWW